ncbi:MAG TPA: hypothetical protein VLX92_16260, partial [Kofleriaceae bacterium]|nr:hypothetical protein [Kofleriaceae bacterium]
LQHFLTGQLVASHHYSRREKIVRYVRKNRALVGVIAAALAALIIGSWIAIGRVLDERDRADDEARIARDEKRLADERREQVTESLQQLTITDARTNADADPTRAVAMIRPLATTKWWRQVRAIAAAARAHGVAFGMPASPHVLSLDMSRDGQRVLAAGNDGTVKIYDLARHDVKELAALAAPATARFADGEHAVVIAHDREIVVVDVATLAQHRIATALPVARLDVSGPIAYWTDSAGGLWRLDVARTTPEQVEVGEPVNQLVHSPDGRWIALATPTQLLLLDRTQPTLPPQQLHDRPVRDISWAADGETVVVLTDDEALAFALPSGQLVHRQMVGARYAIAYSDNLLFSTAVTGVTISERDTSRSRRINGDYTLGLHEAAGGVMVTGGPQGVLAVILADDDLVLHTPALRISRIETSPRSPWVVAAADGRLLAWNLDALVPRRFDEPTLSGARFVSGDQLIEAFADQPAQWLDLRTGAQKPIGVAPVGIYAVVGAPDGMHALLIDGTHRGRLVSSDGSSQDVDGDLELAAFADDGRLAVATTAGVVRLDDHQTRRQTTLANHPAGVIALAARPDWVAGAFADRVVWRTRLGRAGSAALEVSQPPPRGGLALDGDGTVVFATGPELRTWAPDGTVASLCTFDKPIGRVALGEAGIIAVTTDGFAHVVDRAHPHDAQVQPVLASRPSIAQNGLIASTTTDGALDAIDPAAGERFTLAVPKGRTFSFTQISPDGKRVLAVTQSGVLVWTLALPDTPEATAHWLDELTNALAAGPSAPLGWR